MAHDVFISYSSKDKPTADAVCFELELAGIRCWIAPRDILPGQHWGAAIVEAINSSELMVLVLSAHANASEQVLREVERSVHRAMPIIPFRIEEFELASAFEYYLSVPHWLDAMTGPLEDHIQRLVHTTKVLLEQRRAAGSEPIVAPTASPPPASDRARDNTPLAARLQPEPKPSPPPARPAPTVRPATPVPSAAPSPSASSEPPLAKTRLMPRAQRAAAYVSRRPTSAPGRPIWIWAIPIALVVMVVIALAITRLAPGSPTGGPASELTPVVAGGSIGTPTLRSIAPPATELPQVQSGTVRVTSSVEGATILVNGNAAGRTPQTLSLQPGQYELALQAASYRDWSQVVQISEGQQLPVQAILEPLPPVEVLELTERVMGRDAVVDSARIVRVRAPAEVFEVSDVVNAVVYFRPKTFQIRDISYNVTHRWQIAGETEPGIVAATSRGSRDEPLLFTHACALASQLDPRGSNTPLTLEVLVDGETVARFNFRIAGGSLANAPRDPVQACDRSRLPNIVVIIPDALAAGAVL
jgi:hypothetical protein